MPARRHTDDESIPDAGLTIEAPDRSPRDEPIEIRVTGAAPGEVVTFEATTTDRDGCEWRSRMTFTADDTGVIDLTAHAPESGSYEGVAPMGWCWSMRGPEDQPIIALMTADSLEVSLRATAGGRTAERTIARVVGAEIDSTGIDEDGVVGTVYEPDDSGPHPGVLVLHGSGGSPVDMDAALLAARGFAAFALQYVGDHDALPDELRRIPISYFDRAVALFRARSSVRSGPLGIVGHSRGAEIGLYLGTRYDWAGPVISYAGSAMLWNAPSEDPAWLDEDGTPLPFVSGRGKPTLLEGQLEDADEEARREATIPVEEMDAPVLFVTGAKDPIWPASRTAELAIERLERADFGHAFDHLCYEDAGHFITLPFLPKAHPVFAGSPAGLAAADADSWPVVLEYLERGLASNPDETP